ncbi:MAG: DUF4465 domain-containing protein [Bacteroidales bacterium]|jgi:hypothetical protein|nr:DUF4465 domain-containing protein [Bacteroidales bacterium]
MKKFLLFLCFFTSVNLVFCQEIVDFEELTLAPESAWNGSDNSGSFTSKYLKFYNDFDENYSSWMGWAYTNQTDNTTNSYLNQYSSIVGKGVENSQNYAVAYVGSDWINDNAPIPSIIKIDDAAVLPENFGMFVSLNTFASLYMNTPADFYENGNHWLKLQITVFNISAKTTLSKEIILADYRFQETEGFTFNEWTYVDMSWLNPGDSLLFTMSSSDFGTYGINTPTYFCIDNFGDIQPLSIPGFSAEIKTSYTINSGESVDLTAYAKGGVQPYFFTWNEIYYNQTVTVSPEVTTNYQITVSDAAGNMVSEIVTVNVNQLSVTETAFNNLKINRQNALLSIINDKTLDNIEIFDLNGKQIFRSNINSSTYELPINNFSNGMYIIRLFSENQIINKKIIF